MHPPNVSPVENLETLRLDPRFELRRHLSPNEIELFVGVDHHGDVQAVDAVVDARQPDARDRDGVHPAALNLAHQLGVVTGHAAGVDANSHRSARDAPPFLRHVVQRIMPARSGWRSRTQFDTRRTPPESREGSASHVDGDLKQRAAGDL